MAACPPPSLCTALLLWAHCPGSPMGSSQRLNWPLPQTLLPRASLTATTPPHPARPWAFPSGFPRKGGGRELSFEALRSWGSGRILLLSKMVPIIVYVFLPPYPREHTLLRTHARISL